MSRAMDEIRAALQNAIVDRLVADHPDMFSDDSGDDSEYGVEVVIYDKPGLRISVLFHDAGQDRQFPYSP